MNKNLLNNQNYILWNTEKKKLLSKFFVEKFLRIFYKIISILYHYSIPITLLILAFIFTIIFLLYSLTNAGGLMFTVFMIIILIIPIIIIAKNLISKKVVKITSFNDFILLEQEWISLILIGEILWILVEWLILKRNILSNIDNFMYKMLYSFLIFVIWYFIFFSFFVGEYSFVGFLIFVVVLNFINFVSVLLLPILIILVCIWIIYILIQHSVNSYYFIKFSPKTKILKKFKKLGKNDAENNYYKLELKSAK